MNESFWGIGIISFGIIGVFFILFFQDVTNTDEHNYNLLKETTESAMYDAFDYTSYYENGTVRIDREKFVESFVRRFAENATLANTYKIKIYDINETPPKVSLSVSSSKTAGFTGEVVEFNIPNRLDAILETPY